MAAIRELLKNAAAMLKDKSDTPVLDAELIFVEVCSRYNIAMDKIKLLAHGGSEIDEQVAGAFREEIFKRQMGTPVQYITHKQEFMGLGLYVREGVLIPRPDTEVLVEEIIKRYKFKRQLRLMDMCTGSGAIAVSLAYYLQASMVYAVDISDAAIECTSVNIDNYDLGNRVKLVNSDMFGSLDIDEFGCLDVIASNPPYIPTPEIEKLSVNVKDYEPRLALDGGVDGLSFYREIADKSWMYLNEGGMLFLEIGYNQAEEVKALLAQSGHYCDIEIEKDLAGWDRVVFCKTKHGSY
ncbi:MAG: peptide chain release factor N(5)-glutamine methyltransferase [Bacillota bacterium]